MTANWDRKFYIGNCLHSRTESGENIRLQPRAASGEEQGLKSNNIKRVKLYKTTTTTTTKQKSDFSKDMTRDRERIGFRKAVVPCLGYISKREGKWISKLF